MIHIGKYRLNQLQILEGNFTDWYLTIVVGRMEFVFSVRKHGITTPS